MIQVADAKKSYDALEERQCRADLATTHQNRANIQPRRAI